MSFFFFIILYQGSPTNIYRADILSQGPFTVDDYILQLKYHIRLKHGNCDAPTYDGILIARYKHIIQY